MQARTVLDFFPAAILALLTVCTPLLVLTEPVDGPDVAAVFPPGWQPADVMQAVARADVGLVRFGAFGNIGIVEIGDPDALARLRAAGAWLTLPPQALGGCLLGDELTTATLHPPTGARNS